MKAIQRLLNHPKVDGNQSEAARLLGKSPQIVRYWATTDTKETDIPVNLIRKAAKAIGERPTYLIPD